MKYLIALILICAALPANTAELPQPQAPAVAQPKPPVIAAPTVDNAPSSSASINSKPGKLTPVQQLRVATRVPQVKKAIADLSVDEQRAVLRKSAPPRVKLTDAERDARAKAARDKWTAKTPAMRTELRQKQLAAWQKLSPADRAYRKERMQEQLKALPEEDRKAIIAPWVASNAAPVAP